MFGNQEFARRWANIYKAIRGKCDFLLWSEDIDLSGGPAEIARAGGMNLPVTPGSADYYRLRSGWGTPRLMAAWATTEDAGGCVAAYLLNNKESRNIYFNTAFDLGDVAFLDFSAIGGMPLEEGSDMGALYDIATGAASQQTVCAMIYYPDAPEKEIWPDGAEVVQAVSLSASVTPTANTMSFPGDDLISGFVAGTDLPPGGSNVYVAASVSTSGTTNSDSCWGLKHPDYADHIFCWPTTRAVAYSQSWVTGPGWVFKGDNPPLIGLYGQAGGASVVWFILGILP